MKGGEFVFRIVNGQTYFIKRDTLESSIKNWWFGVTTGRLNDHFVKHGTKLDPPLIIGTPTIGGVYEKNQKTEEFLNRSAVVMVQSIAETATAPIVSVTQVGADTAAHVAEATRVKLERLESEIIANPKNLVLVGKYLTLVTEWHTTTGTNWKVHARYADQIMGAIKEFQKHLP